jgi:hypothetical protein
LDSAGSLDLPADVLTVGNGRASWGKRWCATPTGARTSATSASNGVITYVSWAGGRPTVEEHERAHIQGRHHLLHVLHPREALATAM